MLDKINFVGFDILGSQFELSGKPKGKGYYTINVEVGEIFLADEELDAYCIEVLAVLTGHEEGSDEPGFTAEAKLAVNFTVQDKELNISDGFYRDNAWFFDSYIAIVVKQSLENLLHFTPLNGIVLPAYPTNVEHI